jgi:hypothetical protein
MSLPAQPLPPLLVLERSPLLDSLALGLLLSLQLEPRVVDAR